MPKNELSETAGRVDCLISLGIYEVCRIISCFLNKKFRIGTLGRFGATVLWGGESRVPVNYSQYSQWFYDAAMTKPLIQPL